VTVVLDGCSSENVKESDFPFRSQLLLLFRSGKYPPTGCFYIALRLNSGRSGKEKGYSMADGLEQQIHCGLCRAYKAKAYA